MRVTHTHNIGYNWSNRAEEKKTKHFPKLPIVKVCLCVLETLVSHCEPFWPNCCF